MRARRVMLYASIVALVSLAWCGHAVAQAQAATQQPVTWWQIAQATAGAMSFVGSVVVAIATWVLRRLQGTLNRMERKIDRANANIEVLDDNMVIVSSWTAAGLHELGGRHHSLQLQHVRNHGVQPGEDPIVQRFNASQPDLKQIERGEIK